MTGYRLKIVSKIPGPAVAMAIYPFMFVQKGHEHKKWLLEHEKVHLADQRKTGTFAWLFRYFTDSEFRYKTELEAHTVAVMHGQPISEAARHLSSHYRLDLTAIEAKALIQNRLQSLDYYVSFH